MQTDAPLNRRAQEILHSVVKEYIETGEPVGSRTISKRRSENLSAASIRNVMADLISGEQGYRGLRGRLLGTLEWRLIRDLYRTQRQPDGQLTS